MVNYLYYFLYYKLMYTISARIPEELKKKLKEYGINVSDIVRKALMKEVKKKEAEKIKKELQQLKAIRKLSSKEITVLIREDRER